MYEKTISKFKSPIGEGISRVAFYSKKYDLIFKRNRSNTRYTSQTDHEIEIVKKLTAKEKTVFPIVDILILKDNTGQIVKWIVMKKALKLSRQQFRSVMKAIYVSDIYLNPISAAEELELQIGFPMQNNLNFLKFVRKYKIRDTHRDNIMRVGDQLVVIDAGL